MGLAPRCLLRQGLGAGGDLLAGSPVAGQAVELREAGGKVAVQSTGLGRLAEVVLENKGLDGQSRGALVLAVAHHGLAVCAATFGERNGDST